jgi:Arc/MetJ-type ribon-helix-helix transcriptional regulator
MDKFDFSAPAELFPSRNRKIPSKVKYRRFDSAADAIRFAVEELPEPLLLGAYIEVDEERLGHKDIRALYESERFPRKSRKKAN